MRDLLSFLLLFFFFNDTATTEIYTLSLHDALPILRAPMSPTTCRPSSSGCGRARSEEHTSELQSHSELVCRLLLEKKKKITSPKLHSKKKGQKKNKDTDPPHD